MKMTKLIELDTFDHALLREVQRNNLTPARLLAERVGLSESAVLRRLRRLRSEGVITRDISIVALDALGLPLLIHVLISLERESAQELDAFIRKLRHRPEVRHAAYVTGDADFVVQLRLPDMQAYDAFTQEVFHNDPNVRAFQTLVTIREIAL